MTTRCESQVWQIPTTHYQCSFERGHQGPWHATRTTTSRSIHWRKGDGNLQQQQQQQCGSVLFIEGHGNEYVCRLARGHYGEQQMNVDVGGQGHRGATVQWTIQ